MAQMRLRHWQNTNTNFLNKNNFNNHGNLPSIVNKTATLKMWKIERNEKV